MYQSDSGCAGRAYADVSADADPATGLKIYDSGNGGWLLMGGTSLASPLIAAYYAITGLSATDAAMGVHVERPAQRSGIGLVRKLRSEHPLHLQRRCRLRRTHRRGIDLRRGRARCAGNRRSVRRAGHQQHLHPGHHVDRRDPHRRHLSERAADHVVGRVWADHRHTDSTRRHRTSALARRWSRKRRRSPGCRGRRPITTGLWRRTATAPPTALTPPCARPLPARRRRPTERRRRSRAPHGVARR